MAGWYHDAVNPRALLDIGCSAGTYIRTLCQDIGEEMGCGAYMSFLLRTGVGGYSIDRSFTLEELKSLAEKGKLCQAVVSIKDALSFFPTVEIKEQALKSVGSGATLYPPGIKYMPEEIRSGDMVVLAEKEIPVAVARAVADEKERLCFKPDKIIL